MFQSIRAFGGKHHERGGAFFEQVGWQAAGRKIEVIKEDQENPPTALRKARRLAENDKVDAIIGLVSTAAMYAVRDFMNERKNILIITNAGGNKLCGGKKSPYVFRAPDSNWQLDHPWENGITTILEKKCSKESLQCQSTA